MYFGREVYIIVVLVMYSNNLVWVLVIVYIGDICLVGIGYFFLINDLLFIFKMEFL